MVSGALTSLYAVSCLFWLVSNLVQKLAIIMAKLPQTNLVWSEHFQCNQVRFKSHDMNNKLLTTVNVEAE